MPRTALISDIHGNYPALLAVLADVEREGCSRTLCLGDLIDGGYQDREVIAELRRRRIECVIGNHDEMSFFARTRPEQHYLDSLPKRLTEADVVYTHITPRESERRIADVYEAWNAFEDSPQRLCFIGHIHVPLIFCNDRPTPGEASEVPFGYSLPVKLDPQRRYIICVGAVGYGRDGVNAARYVIYDSDAQTIEFRRVDAPRLDL
jgi:predicted phosphodiesterase